MSLTWRPGSCCKGLEMLAYMMLILKLPNAYNMTYPQRIFKFQRDVSIDVLVSV